MRWHPLPQPLMDVTTYIPYRNNNNADVSDDDDDDDDDGDDKYYSQTSLIRTLRKP